MSDFYSKLSDSYLPRRNGGLEEWSVFLIDYESGMKSCQTVIFYIAHRT